MTAVARCPIHGDVLATGLNGRKMCPAGHFSDEPAVDTEEVRAMRERLEAVEREWCTHILRADQGDWDRTVPTLAQMASARLRELDRAPASRDSQEPTT